MSELTKLTRKTLESVFRVQSRQLMAETMKNEAVKDRVKDLISAVPNILTYEVNERPDQYNKVMKNEINGRLRALLVWLDGKSQFQFMAETEQMNDKIIITSYSNLYWGMGGFIGAMFLINIALYVKEQLL